MLEDLEDRIKQFIKVNDMFLETNTSMDVDMILGQQRAFYAVLKLIRQLKKTGKINRGNEYFPDPVAAMLKEDKSQPTLLG